MHSFGNNHTSAHLKRKYQNLLLKERHLNIISDFAISLLHQQTVNEIAWAIVDKVIKKLDFEDCVIYLCDEKKQQLYQVAAYGEKVDEEKNIINPIILSYNEGIVGSVANSGCPEIVADTRNDERYVIDGERRLSEIAVPIIHNDKVIGVIDSEHSQLGFFNAEHLTLLSTIAAMAAVKISQAKSLEEISTLKKALEQKVHLQNLKLQETITNLKRSNKDLEQFAYAASHDLREPLRTVSSYIGLLRRREQEMKPSSLELLDFVSDGAKRMTELVDGLLEYSRLKHSHNDLKTIKMQDILILLKANLRMIISEKDATINCHNCVTVLGNRTQIIQLFQNIIANAIKFSQKDTPPIINIYAEKKTNFVEFTIEDNGIGIRPENYEKIFDIFSRLNAKEAYEGSGIGLALCKKIVNHHGGEITLSSEYGVGTKFVFTLPMAKEAS